MKQICGLLILLLTFYSVAVPQKLGAQQPADVIYYNAKVITMRDASEVVQAVAIRGNKFLRVGSTAEVLRSADAATRKIDLQGACVVPGLIDSHTHPITAALSEQEGTLPPLNSISEIQAYIRQQAARLPPDRVIFVPKIFAPRLKERRYPTRDELDEAAAENRPVIVDNGYASVLNSFLLKKIGITPDTPQPANGRIGKDARGQPTGLILGAPQLLAQLRREPPTSQSAKVQALKQMQHSYNRYGITSTIDRGQRSEGFRVYQELQRKGELTVRSSVTYLLEGQGTPQQVREEIERLPFYTGWGDDWFRVGSLKIIMDGGILTGTAYLRESYGSNTQIYGYQDSEYRGVLSVPRENVFEIARVASQLGWQMTAHVTGGGALDVLLDAYEAANRVQPIRDRRFSVTHGNFPNQQAVARAKNLGVVFDCQPAWEHLYGDGIKDVFGPQRLKDFLPLRALFDAGVVVAGGSDHMIRFDPRESINPYHPFYGMWMAVTRRTIDGTVLNQEQRITRAEALRMWTLNGAYLSFDEKVKGSIEPGKLADMVVITKDYFSCPVDEIRNIETQLTVVDGKVVYRRPSGV